ncbi:hypothetical protein BT69DRAFT_1347137 [Atractiella rhizophila]|nr:hypothetical protein BT69DRAFT_1347137 [Atractiella rhizophila]
MTPTHGQVDANGGLGAQDVYQYAMDVDKEDGMIEGRGHDMDAPTLAEMKQVKFSRTIYQPRREESVSANEARRQLGRVILASERTRRVVTQHRETVPRSSVNPLPLAECLESARVRAEISEEEDGWHKKRSQCGDREPEITFQPRPTFRSGTLTSVAVTRRFPSQETTGHLGQLAAALSVASEFTIGRLASKMEMVEARVKQSRTRLCAGVVNALKSVEEQT